MLPIPDEAMFLNRFVETSLPTKSQIFARTGQRAVSPAGQYSGDTSVPAFQSKIDSALVVARAAESYEPSSSEPPKSQSDDLPES